MKIVDKLKSFLHINGSGKIIETDRNIGDTVRTQMFSLERNLNRGTMIVKEGHRIKELNPCGMKMEIPLTDKQIRLRKRRLESLKKQIGG